MPEEFGTHFLYMDLLEYGYEGYNEALVPPDWTIYGCGTQAWSKCFWLQHPLIIDTPNEARS